MYVSFISQHLPQSCATRTQTFSDRNDPDRGFTGRVNTQLNGELLPIFNRLFTFRYGNRIYIRFQLGCSDCRVT